MLLALDIGNSNITTGCIINDDILFVERFKADTSKSDLEYVVILQSVISLHNVKKDDIDGVIISSVVPPLNKIIISAVEKYFGVSPLIVGPGVKTGLNIAIENPTSVGSDLIVNAVAGMNLYGAPLILVDIGTATTFGVVNDAKNYIGGVIMPGVRISLDSLVDSTSQLPNISLESPKNVIGRNTVDSMKSGIIFGTASAIDGMIDRVWESLGYETKIVATGALSENIVSNCRHEIIVDPELILKGLNYIYKKNLQK